MPSAEGFSSRGPSAFSKAKYGALSGGGGGALAQLMASLGQSVPQGTNMNSTSAIPMVPRDPWGMYGEEPAPGYGGGVPLGEDLINKWGGGMNPALRGRGGDPMLTQPQRGGKARKGGGRKMPPASRFAGTMARDPRNIPVSDASVVGAPSTGGYSSG